MGLQSRHSSIVTSFHFPKNEIPVPCPKGQDGISRVIRSSVSSSQGKGKHQVSDERVEALENLKIGLKKYFKMGRNNLKTTAKRIDFQLRVEEVLGGKSFLSEHRTILTTKRNVIYSLFLLFLGCALELLLSSSYSSFLDNSIPRQAGLFLAVSSVMWYANLEVSLWPVPMLALGSYGLMLLHYPSSSSLGDSHAGLPLLLNVLFAITIFAGISPQQFGDHNNHLPSVGAAVLLLVFFLLHQFLPGGIAVSSTMLWCLNTTFFSIAGAGIVSLFHFIVKYQHLRVASVGSKFTKGKTSFRDLHFRVIFSMLISFGFFVVLSHYVHASEKIEVLLELSLIVSFIGLIAAFVDYYQSVNWLSKDEEVIRQVKEESQKSVEGIDDVVVDEILDSNIRFVRTDEDARWQFRGNAGDYVEYRAALPSFVLFKLCLFFRFLGRLYCFLFTNHCVTNSSSKDLFRNLAKIALKQSIERYNKNSNNSNINAALNSNFFNTF